MRVSDGSSREWGTRRSQPFSLPSSLPAKKHLGISNKARLIAAIEADDVESVAALLSRRPKLREERLARGGFAEWGAPLHVALKDGSLKVATFLVQHGADVAARNRDSFTGLHISCQYGYASIARLLLDRGAEIESRGPRGHTPLLLTASSGLQPECRETIEILIAYGADLAATCDRGLNAFELAGISGNRQAITVLLSHGFRLDLRAAILLGRSEDVRRILREEEEAVERTPEPERLLAQAVVMIQHLVQRERPESLRFPVNDDQRQEARRIVRRVVEGNLDILEMLVSRGIVVRSKSGLSALGQTLQWADPTLAEFLLRNGALAEYDLGEVHQMWICVYNGRYFPGEMADLLCRYVNPSTRPDDFLRRVVDTKMVGLQDEDPGIRMHAAMSLGPYGQLAAHVVPALRDAVKDRDELVREAAADALRLIERSAQR